ncbi:MAG: hypothetical protein PVJ21_14320 [Anaerolineales bacterium]|jgi:hypothetical protein
MMQETEGMTFHNENAISRISLWSNIIGITILVFSLIGFANTAYSIISNWSQVVLSLPSSIFERIAVFASQVFLEPLKGVFYFLALRGISQLLYLGLDLYYANVEDEDEDEVEETLS